MNQKPRNHLVIPAKRIEHAIYSIRGQRVMLDADLAKLYGVPTKKASTWPCEEMPTDFLSISCFS